MEECAVLSWPKLTHSKTGSVVFRPTLGRNAFSFCTDFPARAQISNTQREGGPVEWRSETVSSKTQVLNKLESQGDYRAHTPGTHTFI